MLFISCIYVILVSHACEGEFLWPRNRKHVNSHERANFAILNTLANYTKWSSKEEEIVAVLQTRKLCAEQERKSVRKLLLGLNIQTKIKRFQHFYSSYGCLNNQQLRQLLWISRNRLLGKWVGYEDMLMNKDGFLYTQQILQYNAQEFLDKLSAVNHETTPEMLENLHCLEIGILALFRDKYSMSIEWSELAHNRDQFNKRLGKLDSSLILQFLIFAVQAHNRALLSTNFESYATAPLNFYSQPLTMFTQERIYLSEFVYRNMYEETGIVPSEIQIAEVCRGSNLQSEDEKKYLRCYYDQASHPLLYINPVKVEQLSRSPPIYQFYELVGNKTIQQLHHQFSPNLWHIQNIAEILEELPGRVMTSVAVHTPKNAIPEMIWALADAVSGLNVKASSDQPHYSDYSVGRWHFSHSDQYGSHTLDFDNIPQLGDRLATMLLYLEASEAGGETVFSDAGVANYPVRGSAVFWIGLFKNGTARPDGFHGSCAVLRGEKIIVPLWMRYFANWNRFKCSLNQFE